MDERTIVPILSKFRRFSMLLQFILNDTDYFEKGISIYFFCYNFQIVGSAGIIKNSV
jgi:hypothetical protein